MVSPMVLVNTSGGMDSESVYKTLSYTIQDFNRELSARAFPDEYAPQVDEYGNPMVSQNSPKEMVVLCDYADDTVASLMLRTDLVQQNMSPTYSPPLRAAICLGRFVQCPIMAVCSLWKDRGSSTPGGLLMTLALTQCKAISLQGVLYA